MHNFLSFLASYTVLDYCFTLRSHSLHLLTQIFVRFASLGVITGKEMPDKNRLEAFLKKLEESFEKIEVSKEEIVDIIAEYLPNFEHMEKGRSLDSKM